MLAQVNATYFGTDMISLQNGSQVPADHWGGYNLLCHNSSLHFAMYWQPTSSPLPVRHALIGVYSDGSSEVYDFDAWDLSVPAASVFNIPSDCHSAVVQFPGARMAFPHFAETVRA
jgi:hypothetical protein